MKSLLLRLLPVFLLMAVTANGSEKKATKGGEKRLSSFQE
jgi:hypothetical protein